MSAERHRNRIINFRVNQEEFRALQEANSNSSQESLSAYARSAALDSRRLAESRETLGLHLDKITAHLEELSARLSVIERLAGTLTHARLVNTST